MTEIERLVELCPCSVEFDSPDREPNGACYWDSVQYFWGTRGPLVEIGSSENEAETLYSLAHETGHALCDAKKCSCGMGSYNHSDRTMSEYHAMKFAAKWLFDHKCKGGLRVAIRSIERQAMFNTVFDSPRLSAHCKAARRLVKLKLWAKCVAYAKENQCQDTNS